jgi:hypothetical protein
MDGTKVWREERRKEEGTPEDNEVKCFRGNTRQRLVAL